MTAKTKHLSRLALASLGLCFLFTSVGCIFGGPAGRGSSPNARRLPPGPPDWATCTIGLQRVQGGMNQGQAGAQHSLQRIRKQTGWRDLHVLRTDQLSVVCRGYFRSVDDDKAHKMLRQIRNYRDPQGQEPFRKAFLVVLPRNKRKRITAGPPQWDVRQAPGNASLCIGFFINDETRKDRIAAAVKKVTALRSQASRLGTTMAKTDPASTLANSMQTGSGLPSVKQERASQSKGKCL